ncbi:MAG: chromosome partitioning protein ParB [Gemmatimonadales bacterium]|nr:MAG: chromosome partitioning protein ParB [Gemmatimonadales bacterium]
MVDEAELSTFDLRYESYRLRNPSAEARLLVSITERGIEEPLEGVDSGGSRLLLNGFKRYRCAQKLQIGHVSYVSLGEDEAAGIIAVLRSSNHRSLSILEQARFIDDLRALHKLTVAEIAETLSRSKAWVSMRLGLIGEMGDVVRERIFRGAFPVYSYMYQIRQFMRMNGVKRQEVEEFVVAVSGKGLSVREIEQLAHGYFRGPEAFRQEIREGHFALVLDRMRQVPESSDGANEFERVLLKDLEIVGKYMQRVAQKSQNPRLGSRAFCAQANILAAGILSRVDAFSTILRELHDRTGQA